MESRIAIVSCPDFELPLRWQAPRFDIVYVMTNTKAKDAEVLASYMYSNAFHYQNYGYGSAIAVVQFIITLGFILVYIQNVLKNEVQV